MLNLLFAFLTGLTCVILFGYLAYAGWKDMKEHEPK